MTLPDPPADSWWILVRIALYYIVAAGLFVLSAWLADRWRRKS